MNHVEVEFNGHKIRGTWRDEVDESVWAEIFKWREYRRAEPVIKDAKVILDVGAHAGFFALYCLALDTNAKILCIEPDLKNISAMEENFAVNGWKEKVKIISGALTDKAGDYWLKLSPDSHNHQVLEFKESNENIKIAGFELLQLLKEKNVDQVDLLKMDIEGGEYGLISSWQAEEFSMLKNIIFEYHQSFGDKDMLVEKLRSNGFGVQIFPSQFDSSMGIIFANNKRIK